MNRAWDQGGRRWEPLSIHAKLQSSYLQAWLLPSCQVCFAFFLYSPTPTPIPLTSVATRFCKSSTCFSGWNFPQAPVPPTPVGCMPTWRHPLEYGNIILQNLLPPSICCPKRIPAAPAAIPVTFHYCRCSPRPCLRSWLFCGRVFL